MAPPEAVFRLGPEGPIQSHAWSADSSMLAVAHGDKDAHVYSRNHEEARWQEVGKLDQHDLTITSIDWAPKSNMIVTCSQDRNAYVWVPLENGQWRHTLVLLRINRAATCVRWSPNENKFAVGSGARIISVCYYDKDNDWWVAKHIKKPLRSTITTVDWHPNNILLAAGSTDYKVRVFSTYIKEIEAKPGATQWGTKMPFANLMSEFSNSDTGGGWVHDVCFSADGLKLAWVAHDSSITVASPEYGVKKLRTNLLPLMSVIWTSLTTLVAGGHDCVPVFFHLDQELNITAGDKFEADKVNEESQAPIAAMKLFRSKDRTGEHSVGNYKISTTHQKQITQLRLMTGEGSGSELISSSGADGRLCLWNYQNVEQQLKQLCL